MKEFTVAWYTLHGAANRVILLFRASVPRVINFTCHGWTLRLSSQEVMRSPALKGTVAWVLYCKHNKRGNRVFLWGRVRVCVRTCGEGNELHILQGILYRKQIFTSFGFYESCRFIRYNLTCKRQLFQKTTWLIRDAHSTSPACSNWHSPAWHWVDVPKSY